LIVSGSGLIDRDGNFPLLKGANNSLKLLAEGLAANHFNRWVASFICESEKTCYRIALCGVYSKEPVNSFL
jgi:hypothetical protein